MYFSLAVYGGRMDNPYLSETEEGLVITPAGEKFLSSVLTDPKGNVYAFASHAPPLTVAAAMARLSRSADDMRVIYLNEFTLDPERARQLYQRVITAFGDDSVQQLMPITLVVEQASNLLTKKLEWGRLAAYLEQSTRYIFFDKKKNGRYRYHIPNLPESIKARYITTMDQIFDKYSAMVRRMTEYYRSKSAEPTEKSARTAWLNATRSQACDVVRSVLPAATSSTVAIMGSAQAIDNMIMNLAAEDLAECTDAANSILREVRKIADPFFERTDRADRGGARVAYKQLTRHAIKELARQAIPAETSASSLEVNLLDYWPKNELDIIPDILYASAQASHREISRIVRRMSDDEKKKILLQYIGLRTNRRHKPGRALEDIHYKWEILADYGTFRDLQRHRMVDGWEWQNLTPVLGYEIPDSIKDVGLEETFSQCFELSTDLYWLLYNAGFHEEAQYAVLFGHYMRYKFMQNARASFHFHELRSGLDGDPKYRRTVLKMHKQIELVHPIVAAGMRFVNAGEDPNLTRLGAELASQQKLAILEAANKG